MTLKIKINSQKIYALIVSYIISFMALLALINEILNIIGIRTILDTMFLYSVLYLLLLIGFIFLMLEIKTIPLDVKMIFICMILLYMLTYCFFADNRKYLFTSFRDYANNPAYYIFLYSLPGYVFARKLKSYEYLKRMLTFFSYIIILFSVVVYFCSPNSSATQYLTFSYNMLFSMIFLIYHKPQSYKMIHMLLLCFGIFVFVFGGSRGAFLAFIASIIIIYMVKNKNNAKKLFLSNLMIVFLVILWMLKNKILNCVVGLLNYLNISSRTLTYIIDGNILEDNARMDIYQKLVNKMNICGHGFMGDRVLLSGGYAHNLFLEWCIDFGILFGILFSIIFIIILFKGIKNVKSKENIYILMLLSNGVFQLMVTGSYLNQSPALYTLLGFCINSILRRSEKKVN